MSRLHRQTHNREWERLRLQVFERDGHRCADCRRAGRLEAHHMLELHRGGTNDLGNLKTLVPVLPYRGPQAQGRSRLGRDGEGVAVIDDPNRCLRGMAHHVLPLLRQSIPNGRSLMKNTLPQGRNGYCRWCGLRVTGKGRRLWDEDCNRQYGMVLGNYPTPGPWREARCAQCGVLSGSLEIDHIYPIHQARESGDPKALVRAFLIENLQWLCVECHIVKSNQERRLAGIRRRAKRIVT